MRVKDVQKGDWEGYTMLSRRENFTREPTSREIYQFGHFLVYKSFFFLITHACESVCVFGLRIVLCV